MAKTQDFEPLFEYLRRKQAKKKYMEENGIVYVKTKTLPLPEDKWHICPTCNGTKSYYMEGDLHKSSGIVPCYRCENGLIKTYTKEVYRVKGRKNVD